MEKVLNNKVPETYSRQNLILGSKLYGSVEKITNVFGKNVEETDWELVSKLPKGITELDNAKLRIYIDEKEQVIEAIEILTKKRESEKESSKKKSIKEESFHADADDAINYESWTVKELKAYCGINMLDAIA